MIAHLVLFRLKPGVGRDDPRLARLAAAMAELPGRIAAIGCWEHGFNTTPDTQAWDYGLRASFADRGALESYFDHPDHLPVVKAWEEVADLAFADFDI